MLEKVKSALLLTSVDSFKASFASITKDLGIKLRVEEEWNNRYRILEDVVICGSKYLDYVNAIYYENLVLILKSDEKLNDFIEKGINRFIFNFNNPLELVYSLLSKEKTVVHASSTELVTILEESVYLAFICNDYDFRFDKNEFKYKGNDIYLCNSQKRYLAEWLLRHNKDNSKRMILYHLRKKFGEDFLKDIDRYGNPKE